jgi:two-component sensor histidine kinase/predicted hydrocarbon binding protein
MDANEEIKRLKAEVKSLKKELSFLKSATKPRGKNLKTVIVPPELEMIFDEAEVNVGKYHNSLVIDPAKASITISGQRYLLVRASALSIEFLEGIMNYYRDRGEKESLSIGKNILFDLAHLIGVEDAKNFSKLMGLTNPVEMLSAGPVHFAYTGWAQVKILPDSHPSPDKNFVLHYSHPFSFEADSWISAGKKSEQPVCGMNSGYSSGWCSYSFGLNLTSVEVTCRARGDKECTFVMAPPDRIQQYLKSHPEINKNNPEVPTFLQRKVMEEKLEESLAEKELLLKEVHHRVKNNLQIISSLLNLQLHTIEDPIIHVKFKESVNRIRAMAALHDLLYRSKNFSSIPVSKYFPSLINTLKDSYFLRKEIQIDLDIRVKQDKLEIDKAIPCGLILNETISNALKYAFEGRKEGRIQIILMDKQKGSGKKYRLTVIDDGIGFVLPPDLREAQTLGMQLIHALVLQLDGEINIYTLQGTRIDIDF